MDITDALDSYLQAQIKVKKWEKQFNEEFYKPLAMVAIATAVKAAASLPAMQQQPGPEMNMRGE